MNDELPPRVYVSFTTRETVEEFEPESVELGCVSVLVGDNVYYFSSNSDGSEDETDKLLRLLSNVDTVVGVNEFFLDILGSYGDTSNINFVGLQSLVTESLGKRVSLNNVAKQTLGRERPDQRRLPLEWSSGRRKTVKRALRNDVLLLRELDEEIRETGAVTVLDPDSMEEVEVEVETDVDTSEDRN